jgi:hypothetical protein
MTPVDLHDIAPTILMRIDSAKNLSYEPEFWDKVWEEESFPNYFNRSIIRKDKKFYRSATAEQNHLKTLLTKLIDQHGIGRQIHEFGAGVGANSWVRDSYVGYEWSDTALKKMQLKGIECKKFNMFKPEPIKINYASIALTVHSMEQLGHNIYPFLDFLRKSKFDVAIHIEPIYEFYDSYDIVDRLAMMWHNKRGYLRGLLDAINPHQAYRTEIGGMMHEAYSVVVWYPS